MILHWKPVSFHGSFFPGKGLGSACSVDDAFSLPSCPMTWPGAVRLISEKESLPHSGLEGAHEQMGWEEETFQSLFQASPWPTTVFPLPPSLPDKASGSLAAALVPNTMWVQLVVAGTAQHSAAGSSSSRALDPEPPSPFKERSLGWHFSQNFHLPRSHHQPP